MTDRDHIDQDRPLDPEEDALVRALESHVAGGRSDESFADVDRLRAALRTLDRVERDAVERVVDAAVDEVVLASRRSRTIDFFAAGLRRSPLLRVLAASLVLHLLALPVVAYMVFAPEPEAPYRIEIELPRDLRPAVAPRPHEELDVERGEAGALLRDALLADGVESVVLEPYAVPSDASAIERALVRRYATLTGRGTVEVVDELPSDPVLAAIAVECVLDRLAHEPGSRREIECSHGDLLRAFEASALDVNRDFAGNAAVRRALARAFAYGLLSSGPDDYDGLDPEAWLAEVPGSDELDESARLAWARLAETLRR
ncbi:MAG: hypothetical protein R3F34_17650 [Planctomycetota bacterium]